MNYVFILGTEECAPNCLATAGAVPAWSGKTRSELTRGDLDGASDFPVDGEHGNSRPDRSPFGFYVMISTCCVR